MEQKTGKLPNPPKRRAKWELLLVGDQGRIISIRGFKWLATFLFLLLILSVSAAVGLYYLYLGQQVENHKLKTSLARYQQMAKQLQNEKEVLAARLVVHGIDAKLPEEKKKVDFTKSPGSEKSLKENQPGELPEPDLFSASDSSEVKNDPENPNRSFSEDISKNEAALNAEKENENKPEKPENVLTVESGLVSVDQFKITHNPDSKVLQTQFKLNNTSDDTVNGYIFVVLKCREDNLDSWLSLPSAQLENGAPVRYKSGRYFAISRFKTIRFKAEDLQDPKDYVQAAVLIYGRDGELLFRKYYPVNT